MHPGLVGWIGILLLFSGCTSAAPPSPTSTGSTASGVGAQPSAPKVLTWAMDTEPTDVLALSGVGGVIGVSRPFGQLAHARLSTDDHTLTPRADLALELPSVEAGTWRINSDGTMDTTWKLRPNTRWHDGTPFTASDLVFWYTVVKEGGIPSVNVVGLDQMRGVSAPDPQTFVIHWSSVYYGAARRPDVGPLPRHLLEGTLAQRDPEAFVNHRYFTSEFIGLGPYRLTSWQPGSQIEFTRFDDYFLGRPPFERVVLRFILDFNTLVSSVLAEAVDVAQPTAEHMDALLDLRRRWEGTGNRVRTDPMERIRMVYIQFRPEYARPWVALSNLAVRQALYHGLDRSAVAQVMSEGLSPVSDSWITPTNPIRKDVESAIPQYPYDPARAQRLLAEAGWFSRGADGILAHAESGERFDLELRHRPGSATERELVVLADYWKQLGIAPAITPVPPARLATPEYNATFSGVQATRLQSEDAWNLRRLYGGGIASAANRWSGRNVPGYSNPRADALQERLVVTIDNAQHVALQRQLLQEVMGDAAFIPMFWDVEVALITKKVKGEVTAVETGWNVFTWDAE